MVLRVSKNLYPVMHLPEEYEIFDFRSGYEPRQMTDFIERGRWGIGGYNEKRDDMYLAPQYENRRNIHMGVDIWAPAGEPVFAPLDGVVAYMADHNQEGNYGGTLILKHEFGDHELYALYGHLSPDSLSELETGQKVKAGKKVGVLGDESENGNWPPHLHYQLSVRDPGEADMPGVVAEEEREEALKVYPDPRILMGEVY